MKVYINEQEREVDGALLSTEEFISVAYGLVKDPYAYKISYTLPNEAAERRLLPNERVYPSEGMRVTISKR